MKRKPTAREREIMALMRQGYRLVKEEWGRTYSLRPPGQLRGGDTVRAGTVEAMRSAGLIRRGARLDWEVAEEPREDAP